MRAKYANPNGKPLHGSTLLKNDSTGKKKMKQILTPTFFPRNFASRTSTVQPAIAWQTAFLKRPSCDNFFPLLLATLFLLSTSFTPAEETPHVRKPLPAAAEIAKLPKDGGKEFNRLIFETSPYLRQHARNPVDWYPWGEEAFARAKKEDKPIFLSVGYSSCHWCHVMEHESFEDEEVAGLLNKHFISVKVDREERPDVDQIYMNATQLFTGSGGWPNSVFLNPAREPWFCGTYFPKKDMPGRIGFTNLLTQLHTAWKDKRQMVNQQGAQLSKALDQLTYRNLPKADVEIGPKLIESALAEARLEFDDVNGGFGLAPSFRHTACSAYCSPNWKQRTNQTLSYSVF